MRLTINSRKLGRSITYSRPGQGYIYADLNGQDGTLGTQICDGGSTRGYTISYSGGDEQAFQRICRRWHRAYVASIDPLYLDWAR